MLSYEFSLLNMLFILGITQPQSLQQWADTPENRRLTENTKKQSNVSCCFKEAGVMTALYLSSCAHAAFRFCLF